MSAVRDGPRKILIAKKPYSFVKLSTSIYDLVLIYVCHFHHHPQTFPQFRTLSRYSCCYLGSLHPRNFRESNVVSSNGSEKILVFPNCDHIRGIDLWMFQSSKIQLVVLLAHNPKSLKAFLSKTDIRFLVFFPVENFFLDLLL